MRSTCLLLFSFCFLGFALSQTSSDDSGSGNNSTGSSSQSSDDGSWDYLDGGDDWTDGDCESGESQSPVDLSNHEDSCDGKLVLDISFNSDVSIEFAQNEHTIVGTGDFSTLYAANMDGKILGYTSREINFRSPSEHMIESSHYDLEMQMVFDLKEEFGDETVNVAIVSILFDASGTTNDFLDAIDIENLNQKLVIDFQSLLSTQLPEQLIYLAYEGSYTFPPCEEVVNWYVVETAMDMSSSQLSSFQAYWSSNESFGDVGNNRNTQLINSRIIKRGGVECDEQFIYFFSFIILYGFINYYIFKLL